MATIPREALDYVTREVNGVSAEAQAEVMRVLERIDWSDITAAREIVVQAVQMALANATTLAAQASADFYDASRILSIGEPMGAVAISGYEPEKTDAAIRSFVRFVERGEVEKFNDQVLQRVDYECMRSAGNSMFRNGANDTRHPKFARVPTGAETCDFCLMLASRGFVYSSEMSAGGVKLDHYHAGCVLPDTVLGAIGVKSLLRRKFEGDVIDITTRGGRHLSVTANHPILTVNGWVKAGMLHDGDALLCGFDGERNDCGVPYVNDSPPSAEQVFEALRLLDASYPVGVEVSSVDFDGESVSNSDVEVVDVNRLLKGHIVPMGYEGIGDESLTLGALFEGCKALNGSGTTNSGYGASAFSPCRIMRGLRLCGPVFRGHLGGTDDSSLGIAAPVNSGIVKPSVNDRSGDPIGIGQLQYALAALVSLDEIGRCGDAVRSYLDVIALEYPGDMSIGDSEIFGNRFDALPSSIEIDYVSVADTRHYVGHVYNLSAGGHWYTANGIITHNCDCRVVAGWDGDDVEGYDTDEIYDRWQSSIDAIATERAEKRGTTVEEERSKIMRGYANSAKNAKKLSKVGASKA